MINLEQFTPLPSLSGGVLIGIAASVLILFCGRIAGISGILAGILPGKGKVIETWRLAFLAGLILAPLLYTAFFHHPDVTLSTSTSGLLLAGFLVGVGTRLGSGCTSGHGVCGLSRFSIRSLAATLVFMVVGFATATLIGYFQW
ncbi:YeeE/YedE family protein [Dickeya zeae]|uniref:YeeE/YedE family protein n=1 Tax=Dickeya zeae TaxID=204042 RepID=UPI0020973539|nr:YeeE/YedE family protein [Dickeya zeae]MCO7260458.1 YeeE/YedE family protein [Dickeya zeae]